jgi:uncharacterized protein YbgA (DUF1722 family)/uncharacterized protein YbbK (DUF523 family)
MTEAVETIRVGVSACLVGREVRYDGGHKRDAFVADTLAEHFELVPVCPEVGIGLGTPRETIRLEGEATAPRLVAPRSRLDHTDSMGDWSRREVVRLRRLELDGFVFKKDSPSCGLFRVRVWGGKAMPSYDGRGLFAAALTSALPLLPVEEEGRLRDPGLRESFVERVFAHRRLTALFTGRWRAADVIAFHSREKLLLLAHDPPGYTALGRLVARQRALGREELRERYAAGYMATLAVASTRRKNTNVLQHAAGYFKRSLGADERAELQEVIGDYHRGLVPLIVPVTLLKHHLRRFGDAYLEAQTYLAPHPKELMLRNHV